MKKKKLEFFPFVDLLEENNNAYFNFNRIKYFNKAKNKTYYGYRYTLEKPIDINLFNCYNNVIFKSCFYKYAPELEYQTIIIFDNKLETVKGE